MAGLLKLVVSLIRNIEYNFLINLERSSLDSDNLDEVQRRGSSKEKCYLSKSNRLSLPDGSQVGLWWLSLRNKPDTLTRPKFFFSPIDVAFLSEILIPQPSSGDIFYNLFVYYEVPPPMRPMFPYWIDPLCLTAESLTYFPMIEIPEPEDDLEMLNETAAAYQFRRSQLRQSEVLPPSPVSMDDDLIKDEHKQRGENSGSDEDGWSEDGGKDEEHGHADEEGYRNEQVESYENVQGGKSERENTADDLMDIDSPNEVLGHQESQQKHSVESMLPDQIPPRVSTTPAVVYPRRLPVPSRPIQTHRAGIRVYRPQPHFMRAPVPPAENSFQIVRQPINNETPREVSAWARLMFLHQDYPKFGTLRKECLVREASRWVEPGTAHRTIRRQRGVVGESSALKWEDLDD